MSAGDVNSCVQGNKVIQFCEMLISKPGCLKFVVIAVALIFSQPKQLWWIFFFVAVVFFFFGFVNKELCELSV